MNTVIPNNNAVNSIFGHCLVITLSEHQHLKLQHNKKNKSESHVTSKGRKTKEKGTQPLQLLVQCNVHWAHSPFKK